jgi:2-C-methyl-D-erythritol 2,4-cyclodiphosphate synthase
MKINPARVGIGYDVHPLVDDRKLVIGGVEIEFKKGLKGHSDADVLVHAICDALIGAAGEGDIGQWFPDTDEKYRGINSLSLLAQVGEKLTKLGWTIANIDSTILAEKPKMAPHTPTMRRNIAETLSIEPSSVNIKATRGEGLGFIGRCEGIAALATASIYKTGP